MQDTKCHGSCILVSGWMLFTNALKEVSESGLKVSFSRQAELRLLFRPHSVYLSNESHRLKWSTRSSGRNSVLHTVSYRLVCVYLSYLRRSCRRSMLTVEDWGRLTKAEERYGDIDAAVSKPFLHCIHPFIFRHWLDQSFPNAFNNSDALDVMTCLIVNGVSL